MPLLFAAVQSPGTHAQSAAPATPPASLPVPPPPPVSAAAVYAVDVSAGTPLYALNPDARRAPASLAKMMTALVVMHAVDQKLITLDDQVTIVDSDLVNPDIYSHVGLVSGDVLTVHQLLEGLLIPSGSDAAHALARYVGGKLPGGDSVQGGDPLAAFVTAMNDLGASLGLTNSHFVNSEGDDAPGQYTSARDLATIAAKLMASPTLAQIVQTPEITITSVGAQPQTYGPLKNTNDLLGQDGIDGIKTGTTDAAGACVVISTHIHGNLVIAVVLGSAPDLTDGSDPTTWPRFADALSVISGIDHTYRWIAPNATDTFRGMAEELAAWQVQIKSSPALVVPADDVGKLRYRLRLGKEGAPNSQVGSVTFLDGSVTIGVRPVYQAPAAANGAPGGGTPVRPAA